MIGLTASSYGLEFKSAKSTVDGPLDVILDTSIVCKICCESSSYSYAVVQNKYVRYVCMPVCACVCRRSKYMCRIFEYSRCVVKLNIKLTDKSDTLRNMKVINRLRLFPSRCHSDNSGYALLHGC